MDLDRDDSDDENQDNDDGTVSPPLPDAAESSDSEGSTNSSGSSDADGVSYDINVAATHSYMGAELESVSGRVVLEGGWRGRVPAMSHGGCVFPGEVVPMLMPRRADAALLARALRLDKLFGLLCYDETGATLSGLGVLCEVFEAGMGTMAGLMDAGEEDLPSSVSFKARAIYRFQAPSFKNNRVPINAFRLMRYVDVEVLPELTECGSLGVARHHSLAQHAAGGGRGARAARSLEAAATPWPRFVHELLDYRRMRHTLQEYFSSISLDKMPEEPVSLSFWAASNLALSMRDRLALLAVDHALLRLRMECRFVRRKSVLCCMLCMTKIARRQHIFPMSSEGVHANYVNLGGYVHDLLTVSAASNVMPSGVSSGEYSWFPGYSWTIATCAQCRAHVGWRFDAQKSSLRPQQFYGLCRNNIQPRSHRHALPHSPPSPLSPHSPLSPLSLHSLPSSHHSEDSVSLASDP